MRVRIAASAVAVLAAAAVFPATAGAHATLISSTPAAGAVVAKPPHEVILRFDEPVQPVTGGTDVVTSSGRSVLGGAPHVAPRNASSLVIPLQSGLSDGDYTVRWRIVSTDGHLIAGVLAFGVGLGQPPPQAASTEGSATDWPFLIARFAYFAGLVLLIGGAVFRVAVSAPALAGLPAQRRSMARLRETHRSTQLLTLAAALMLGGGWVALTRQGSEVAGVSFWQAFNHSGPVGSALQATRFGREFGRGIDIAAAFVVAAALASALSRRWPRAALAAAVPAALLGAWTVVVPGISGHAGDPGRGLLAVIVDALHVGAASIWIGGLAQLVFVVPHMLRGLSGSDLTSTRSSIARRFSVIAVGCAIAIAVTGVSRALWEVSSISQIFTTSYGRALIVKTALFGAALVLGYRNRRALDRFTDVRRRAIAELALLGGVLAAVTVLTDLPPANTPPLAEAAPAGGAEVIPLAGGGRLAVWPGRAGENWVAVWARGGAAVHRMTLRRTDGTRVTLALRRVGDADVALAPRLAAGTYAATTSAGTVTLAIGPADRAPVPTPPLAGQGVVAAGEAADLAVGLQRTTPGTARVTLIAPSGGGVPVALVTASGRTAEPCSGTPACYQVPVGNAAEVSTVVVLRSGHAPVKASIRLPADSAPPAADMLRKAAAAYSGLRSVRSENVLASSPTASVSTTYISQAPDRLSIDVHGGQRSIIIGAVRYDLQPNGTWRPSQAVPTPQPNPFWAPGATAIHEAARTARTVQLTLAIPGGPTFFRLWVNARTHLVTRLRMITAAHFMSERELDFNNAPPVIRPRVG